MEPTTISDIAAFGGFVKDIGFPAAVVLLLLFGGYRLGRFMAPIAKEVADAHVSLITTLEKNDTTKTIAIAAHAELLKGNTVFLEQIHDVVVKKVTRDQPKSP